MDAYEQHTLLHCTFCDGKTAPNPKLCDACQVWDDAVHLFFHRPYKRAGNPSERLASFHDRQHFQRRHDCLVCGQMAEAIDSLSKAGDFGTRDGSEIEVAICSAHILQSLGSMFPGGLGGKSSQHIARLCGNSFSVHCGISIEIQWHKDVVDPKGEQQALCKVVQSRNRRRAVVEFDVSYSHAWHRLNGLAPRQRLYFSVPMVKSWIRDSESDSAVDVPRAVLRDFRLVDTIEGRIVKPVKKVRYVALSYVWGTSEEDRKRFQLLNCNVRDAERPMGLWDLNLPPLISDAITLCIDLGERYMWVDRLCIIQDDARSKHSQVSAMDIIYERAAFTIIALADVRYFKGLPGASSRPRPRYSLNYNVVEQQQRGISQLVLDASALIKESRWSSRGWTFQEQVLSRRQLYISENRIFLVLQGELFAQELLDPTYHEHRQTKLIGGIYLDLRHGERSGHFEVYKISVENYKRRYLTFNNDALNAFAGVGQHLASNMKTWLLFGLPERHFLQAQFWRPDGPWKAQNPELGLPTWSWAGWGGPMSTCTSFGFESAATIGHLVRFHFVDPDRGIRLVREEELWFSEIGLEGLRDADRAFRYEGNLRKLMLSQYDDCGDSAIATWRGCGHSPWEALKHRSIKRHDGARAAKHPDCLVFNSTTAAFRVRAAQPTCAGGLELAPQGFLVKLEILDEDGNIVGDTMEVDLDWANKNLDMTSRQRFVVLAGGRYPPRRLVQKNGVLDKIEIGDGFWIMIVMLVLRVGDAFQRVTVGTLTPGAWSKACSGFEFIILK
ncbi:heterokaryon incompatibility protein domain-containing protein [Trichoderma ceciliae]